jgi:hypothetical protein
VLRFAESPSFYQPYWSEKIMDETRKALVKPQIGLTKRQASRLVERLREYFAAAWVANYEPFIETMFNHRGDRHVLAAAMKAGAQTVVTFNIRHFPAKSTEPLGIEAQSPDEFLVHQFHLRPQLAALKDFRASGRNRPVTQPGLRYALAHGS